MRIHSFTPSTYVNGPGNRAMIHFQGCTLACPGCFNSATHARDEGELVTVQEITDRIPSSVDGITISGGEPFLQADDLLELVVELRKKYDSIVVFSGFYIDEIKKISSGHQVLDKIDVLIDGRFEADQIASSGLHGSSNQTIHLLSSRHTVEEFKQRNVEITIDSDGNYTMTGFPTEELLQGLDNVT